MSRRTLILLLLSATLSAADSAAGHYVLQGVMETGSELLLKPDGTFEFGLSYGAVDLESHGTWRQEDDSVVLDAKISGKPLFSQTKAGASKKPGIRIKVTGPAGDPASNVDVAVMGESGWVKGKTDGHGIVEFAAVNSSKSVLFHIEVYDVTTKPMDLDPSSNEFEYVLNGDAITQVPFKDEHLKLSGKGLELSFFDKDRIFYYRKE